MENPIEAIKVQVETLSQALDPNTYVLIPTSRGLHAIVDRRFRRKVMEHKWYAVVSRGGHTHAVADIDKKRVSLQRYVLIVADPSLHIEDVKNVSFANKLTFDCRLINLIDRVGRTAVMRNRRPKRNTTSHFKGVSRISLKSGEVRWKAQIKSGVDHIFLGTYEDERSAAIVYDAAAYILFENAALYNQPNLCPDPKALRLAEDRIARVRQRRENKL